MKIESLELNISALKDAMGASLKVEDIKKDLIEYGAVVRGYRDEQNRIIMVITGDIDIEDVENVFGVYGVDVNDFVIDEDEYIPDYDDYDDVEVFDNKNTKRTASHINERKGDCCPKKKNMVNLAEALSGNTKVKTAGLDTIIDNITGKHISENVAISAIKKAKKESTKAYLIEHLDAKKYNMIWESLESGKKSLYENVKINKKSIADYTKDELVAIREKVLNQISALEGLAEKEDELARKKKLSSILEDEISFRTANAMLSEEDAPSGLEFKDLNPNSTNEDEQNKNNDDEQDSEEQSEEQNDEDTNDNPDKDEEVEIGSIIVTLASKQAAEDLAQDLYDAGVPEDAVEIEPVESEDEEDTSEENAEESEENSDEETAEPAEEEKPEESVKTKGNKVNEADDDSDEEKTEDDDAEGEKNTDEDSDDAEAEEETPHKLILTNTDYVNELADVLENIWGMEHSEFEELIGGEIVSSDDTEDKSDDADETSDDMDFDPDKIFNDL